MDILIFIMFNSIRTNNVPYHALFIFFRQACKRCGRWKDADLSVQQALTQSPHNLQLIRVRKYWAENTLKSNQYNYPILVQMDLRSLLSLLPNEIDRDELVFTKVIILVYHTKYIMHILYIHHTYIHPYMLYRYKVL